MKDKMFIRKEIQKILREEEEEKKKTRGTIRRGKVGQGRIKDKVKEAKALASKDPKKLMKNLNISGVDGDTTQKKILSLVRNAIYGTSIMSVAYSGATLAKDQQGKSYIRVVAGDLGVRDGALYMLHTITGADNAGILGSLDFNIEVGVKQGQIVVEFLE
jgi:hypothetical protein